MNTEKQKSADLLFIAPESADFPDPFLVLRRDLETLDIKTATLPSSLGRPQASIELLGLTALACLFLKPFFSSMLSEMGKQAGKDAYPLLKKGLGRVWSGFDTPSGTPKLSKVTSEGPVPSEYSPAFSLMAVFRWGNVKLLLREDCELDEFHRAFDLFIDLMKAYHSGKTVQNISLDEEKDCYQGVICVEYDKPSDSLEVVNPFARLNEEQIESLRRMEKVRRQGMASD